MFKKIVIIIFILVFQQIFIYSQNTPPPTGRENESTLTPLRNSKNTTNAFQTNHHIIKTDLIGIVRGDFQIIYDFLSRKSLGFEIRQGIILPYYHQTEPFSNKEFSNTELGYSLGGDFYWYFNLGQKISYNAGFSIDFRDYKSTNILGLGLANSLKLILAKDKLNIDIGFKLMYGKENVKNNFFKEKILFFSIFASPYVKIGYIIK